MLNPVHRDGESENEKAREQLVAAEVEVRESSPAFAHPRCHW
jgi:hypothetical protein